MGCLCECDAFRHYDIYTRSDSGEKATNRHSTLDLLVISSPTTIQYDARTYNSDMSKRMRYGRSSVNRFLLSFVIFHCLISRRNNAYAICNISNYNSQVYVFFIVLWLETNSHSNWCNFVWIFGCSTTHCVQTINEIKVSQCFGSVGNTYGEITRFGEIMRNV